MWVIQFELPDDAGQVAAAPPIDAWIARIGTPEVQERAIRALQSSMPRDVAERFGIEADGSFLLDTMLIEAEI